MKQIAIKIDTNEKCYYCGNKANYIIGKRKIFCCSDHYNKCPSKREKCALALKKAHAEKSKWYTSKDFKIWNKGLKKETSHSVLKYSNTLKQKYKNGEKIHPWVGRKHSDKTKEKWKKNPNMGGLRKGSGLGKKGWYKNYYCRSTWELAWLVYHLDNGIEVKQCNEFFIYLFEGIEHRYFPDFIINDVYYEIKGYKNKYVEAKIEQFPNNKKLVMIEGNYNIKPYLDYCINTYGRFFWEKLYESEVAVIGSRPD